MASTVFHANPFPGIRSYEIRESHLFFGRENQIKELLDKLTLTRFLAIVGSSGCGKSSLIKAGLIPDVMTHEHPNLPKSWKLITFRPADDPLGNLIRSLSSEFHSAEWVEEEMLGKQAGIAGVVKLGLQKDQACLLYIDQFEELFRFKSHANFKESSQKARQFIALIEEVVHQHEVPVFLIVSMRTDFLDDCTEFRGLSELINEGYYLVPRMNNEERKKAVIGPILASGNSISEELVDRLLNDVGEDPDQLPIMQHALMRTWDYWTMNRIGDQAIETDHYQAIGGMQQALSIHLEEIYADLNDEKFKYYAEKLFKALTDLTKESRGTRRPTALSELCTLTGAREEEIIRIIDHFRSPGCAFLMPASHISLDGSSIIDISHESIMRVWFRLKKWVEEEGESAQLYLRLSKSAELYQEGKTGLWVNPELQLALQWKDQTRPNLTWAARYNPGFDRAMTFLNHSKRQFELELANKERIHVRNLKRAKYSAVVLGIASVVSILFLIISLNLRFKAEASKKEAMVKEQLALQEKVKTDEQRKEAILQRKISEQQQQIAEQQELISEKQRQYAVSQQQIAQVKTIEAVTQRKQADVARQKAVEAKDEAQNQRKEAVSQKQIAERERQKAEESEREARRLRMLAVANSLAIQAQQLAETASDEVPALIALAAYQLNTQNKGSLDNPDIYSALSMIAKDPQVLRGHLDAVRDIAMSASENQLFSCSDDKQVLAWNLNQPAEKPLAISTDGKTVRSLAVLGNSLLAGGTTDGMIQLWSLTGFKKLSQYQAHTSCVQSLLAGPAGDAFFSVSSDGKLIKHTMSGNSAIPELLYQHGSGLTKLAANNDLSIIFAGTSAGDLLAFRNLPGTWQPFAIFSCEKPIASIAFSQENGQLAVGLQDGSIQLLRLENTAFLPAPVLKGMHISTVSALAFINQGQKLLSGSFDWTIKIAANPYREETPIAVKNHELWVYDLLYRESTGQIISCSADKTIRIFSRSTDSIANRLTSSITRNLTPTEWSNLVGPDVPYMQLNPSLP